MVILDNLSILQQLLDFWKWQDKVSNDHTPLFFLQEAEQLLGGDKPDADAMTRGQQKKIDEISKEAPSPKKARMQKQGTMAVTAKVYLLLVSRKYVSHVNSKLFWIHKFVLIIYNRKTLILWIMKNKFFASTLSIYFIIDENSDLWRACFYLYWRKLKIIL